MSATAAGSIKEWMPEGPFARDSGGPGAGVVGPVASRLEIESPFLPARNGALSGTSAMGPLAESYVSTLAELEDPDFSAAVRELANEAASVLDEALARKEVEEQVDQELEFLNERFRPVEREMRRTVERLEQALADADPSTIGEQQLAERLAGVEHVPGQFSPAEDQFIGGFLKKAKKVVGKVAKVAKKLAPIVFPFGLILGKLKKLAEPLLRQVLKVAVEKLPPALQGPARQLAKRFLGLAVPVPADRAGTDASAAADAAPEGAGEPAAQDTTEIARDFDGLLTSYLVEGPSFERSPELHAYLAGGRPACALRDLAEARRRFAQRVVALKEGEDPTPVVEEFLPAVLAALKLGIKVVGRKRVIGFLAKIVAGLISKYVGKESAASLSRALVGAGLKLAGLEVPGEPLLAPAGEALAATVEDTVAQLLTTAPEAAWTDEALLAGYVQRAFEGAAAAHFPDAHIRPELREAAETDGVWAFAPAGGAPPAYKKFSRVPEVVLTPQVTRRLATFGGAELRRVLQQTHGVRPDQTVRARVHLFEAIPGTTLSRIALHEKGTPGLGSARAEAWSSLHPLTSEAAGLLLREPGLGRDVAPRFLVDRDLIAVGQRFYFLELSLPERIAPQGERARTSQSRVAIDLPRGELRVFLYYSEDDAAALSGAMQRGMPITAILEGLKPAFATSLHAILSGAPTDRLRIVHERVEPQRFLPQAAAAVLRRFGPRLAEILLGWVLEALKRELEARFELFGEELQRAVQSDERGVTVVLVFRQPTLLDALRAAFAPDALAGGLPAVALGSFQVLVLPGFVVGTER